ncbi:hypothetical protein PCANB_002295 [Pneumocystis canis]|nr:hypothetical protein PCK1_002279 [Pneumocystis canis]KAG5438965.1 hypothetical protein PCANB_002295 [Pneumocystis canis]
MISDFKKFKHKVGKRKTRSQQLTNLSFKTKYKLAIIIPKQLTLHNISNDNITEKTSLLMHILTLTKHASGNKRRDALNTLKNHLSSSSLESTILTPIIKTVVPLMIDRVPSVRKALQSLLLSIFSENSIFIQPYILFIVLYIHLAMTHILPDIRDDSTKILLWLLEIQGDHVVKYTWDKFLDTFSVLFGWKNDNKTMNVETNFFKPSFSQESRYYHFKAFDIFLKKGLYCDVQKNTQLETPIIQLHQTKYLSGINHPMVLKYLGKPLKSSPYFHLSLFSQVNNVSKKNYDDISSRSELFYSYIPGLLYCLQAAWLELLPSSIDLPSPIVFQTCILIISILDHINFVLTKTEADSLFLKENLKTMHNFILRIELTLKEFKSDNESSKLRKYWIKTGLYKE